MELSWIQNPIFRAKVLVDIQRMPVDSEEVMHAQARLMETELVRRLLSDQNDSGVIPYHPYNDILFGLKVMEEAGMVMDPRCVAALDLLESKRVADGGFPAEGRYYRVDEKPLSGHSRVDWGGMTKRQMNHYVTVDALSVLKAAGRSPGVYE